ncbi:helix-turn-helix transcriptional regulator [Streptomyces sp. LUP30]|uniref:ArsR/SmtB family transcription factor n=1 Tax=Streptomyces sp. LUP30 TaxID=1890285 RepID=UPI0008519505|nr:helix-turn-helix domain-containing protein [Streptomyces sp. LUP30]
MTTYSKLQLGNLSDLHVHVIPHPGASLLSLVADAFGERRHAVPHSARRAVRTAAPAHAEATLRPLFAPEHPAIPDCLTPTGTMSHEGAARHLEHLQDLSGDVLLADLEAEFGGDVPPQWRHVTERPRQWLYAYAQVMRSVWKTVRPVWTAAGGALGREAERVGGSLVYGRPELALSALSPRYRLDGTVLRLPDEHPEDFALLGRRLLLVPVASGSDASLFAFDGPDTVWVGYPLPGLDALWAGRPPEPGRNRQDPAQLILGDARAAILRATSAATHMGSLSSALGYAPGTLSHHCARLENAGLIHRRRQGQHVVVRRTQRGSELLDLLTR